MSYFLFGATSAGFVTTFMCLVTDQPGKSNSWLVVGLFFSPLLFVLASLLPFPLLSQCALQVWAATSRGQSPFYQRNRD